MTSALAQGVTATLAPLRTLAALTDAEVVSALGEGDVEVAAALCRLAHPGIGDLEALRTFWTSPLGQALREVFTSRATELDAVSLPGMTLNEAALLLEVAKSTAATMRARGTIRATTDGRYDAADVWGRAAAARARRDKAASRS